MRSKTVLAGAAILLLSGASALAQEDVAALAGKFGALEDFHHIALSPDGTSLSMVRSGADFTAVVVADLTGKTPLKRILGMKVSEGAITSCVWSAPTRLVCNARYVVNELTALAGYSRAFAVNADGTGLVQLSAQTNSRSHYAMQFGGSIIDYDVGGNPGAVLMTRDFVPDTQTGSRMGSDAEGYGVEVVDTISLKRRTLEAPRREANEYISDGHGVVRVMGITATNSVGDLKGSTRLCSASPVRVNGCRSPRLSVPPRG